MGLKDYLNGLYVKNCFKGALLVFFGMLNARAGVSVARLDINFVFGTLSFFAIVGSGMFAARFYKDRNKYVAEGRAKSIFLQFTAALGFGIGAGTALGAGIRYYMLADNYIVVLAMLGILIALFVLLRTLLRLPHASTGAWLGIGVALAAWNGILCNTLAITLGTSIAIGASWILLSLFGDRWIKNGAIKNLLDALPVPTGLIYGAAINGVAIPMPIFSFFLALSTLLVSRELIKDSIDNLVLRKRDKRTVAGRVGIKRSVSAAMVLEGMAVLGMAISTFTGLINNWLYLFPLLFVIILGIFSLLMFRERAKITSGGLNRVRKMQRWMVFLIYVAIIFAAV